LAANIQPIALVSTFGLHSLPLIPDQVEGASQTFKKGTPLVWSSGLLVAAGTTPTSGLVGISCAAGQNVTTSPACQIIPFLKSLIFEITIDGTLSSSNAPGTGSLTQANVGTTYAITKDAASGLFYLVTSGGTAVCTLLGFQTNINNGTNDAGVVNGRALVSFLASTSVWT
jgi:hypothetical protein